MVAPASSSDTADPTSIVIFGATGDLTKRKLIPALLRMFDCALVHAESRIIGVVRNMEHDQWVNTLRAGLREYSPRLRVDDATWTEFASRLVTVTGDLDDASTYEAIAEAIPVLGGSRNAMFYCAIPPRWYGPVACGLEAAGLIDEAQGYRRLVIEKPFGMDLPTAQALNEELLAVCGEHQIYRIDHYLGKESVQNLLVYRFANSIMEPLWNRNYIDSVQISAAETLGIEYRAGYYERSGALRDMIQSHLMQLMTLVAMEPPVEFTANAVRDEKMKVLRAVRHLEVAQVDQYAVGAQYASGTLQAEQVPAYVAEQGVAPDSSTETFAAVKFHIDNWRWQGVPFILWSGKRMAKKVSEVVIRFRKPPFNLFDNHASAPEANTLVFRLQPDGGIALRLNAKKTGLTTDNQALVMSAPYAHDEKDVADAYEVLMHDVLIGDETLFSRSDEVEESWSIVAPILQAWAQRVSIDRYRAGTWDVSAMEALCADCVDGWFRPE